MILFLAASSNIVFAQKVPKIKKTINQTINNDKYYTKASILNVNNPKIKNNETLQYYWYYNNGIHTSHGDVGGKVLHGDYIVYYNNGNLKEKGKFNKGLKHGKWIDWYDNGRISEITYWKRGLQNCVNKKFNAQGFIIVKAHYRNGLLQGKCMKYDNAGKITSEVKYKKGKEVPPKNKKEKKCFLKKIFCKNKKQACDSSKTDSIKQDKKIHKCSWNIFKKKEKQNAPDKNDKISSGNKEKEKNKSNISQKKEKQEKQNVPVKDNKVSSDNKGKGKTNIFQKIKGWFKPSKDKEKSKNKIRKSKENN
jgi:antitoxin component YwqK of YwqJK toxin-antitoxin module